MSGRLRIGVIGAGSWTVASHLPALARHPDVELTVVNRRDPILLERIRSEFGFKRASTHWEDVIAERPDVVVIGSPAAVHYEQARGAMEAGAHVLCEKPFTITSRDAWELASLADRLGRHLVIAFGWNYRQIMLEARRQLGEDGGIGPIEHLSIYMASATRELLTAGGYRDAAPESAPRPETWSDPAISGGGYGQAQISHALGIALGLTGLRAAEVFAFMARPPGAAVELHDALSVRFEGGAIGTISGASNHQGAGGGKHQVELRLIGAEGQLLLDLERDVLWRHRAPSDDAWPTLEPDAGRYDCLGPIDAILDLTRGRGINRTPAELGARTVELLEAGYRSAASGRPAMIDLSLGSGAQTLKSAPSAETAY